MADRDDGSRNETLARLAQSRAEIRHVLEPARRQTSSAGGTSAQTEEHFSQFPRSRTMRMLMTGRGLGTVGAMVGGLLMARPALALRLVRLVPASAVARMLLVRAIGAFRSR